MENTASKAINQNAPVKISQSIHINAPIEKVWQIFSDVNNWKTWQKNISSATISGPFVAGTSFDWKTGGLTICSTLHTVEPYNAIGWSGKAFGAFAIHNWSFVRENGTTTVNVEESMEGWLVSLLKKMFQSKLESGTQQWLSYLKTRSENTTQ